MKNHFVKQCVALIAALSLVPVMATAQRAPTKPGGPKGVKTSSGGYTPVTQPPVVGSGGSKHPIHKKHQTKKGHRRNKRDKDGSGGYVPVTAPKESGLHNRRPKTLLTTHPGDESFGEYDVKLGDSIDATLLLTSNFAHASDVRAEAFYQPVSLTGKMDGTWTTLDGFATEKPTGTGTELHWKANTTGWRLGGGNTSKDYWVMVLVHTRGSRNSAVGAHIYRFHCNP